MGPDEMAGKKKRKAKNWPAGSETISRSRMPKMTSRLRNVTYEIPKNPQLGAWDGQRQESGPDQGEQGQQQRRGEGPVPRGARPHPEESLGHDPLEDAAGHHHPDSPDLREPAGD